MKKRLLLSLVVALAVVAGDSVISSARVQSPRKTCRPAKSKTILVTDRLRVFRTTHTRRPRFYGCLFARRTPVLIASALFRKLWPVAVAGDVVGFQLRKVTREHVELFVGARNLRTGELHDIWEASSEGPERRYYRATDVGVTRAGALVWIAEFNTEDDRRISYEVRASDAAGAAQLLDSGRGIDPESLAVTTTTAYWTVDGRDRSRRLR